jgi:hypothetical protein
MDPTARKDTEGDQTMRGGHDPADAHPDREPAEGFGGSEDEQRRVVGQPRDVAP